MSSLRVNKFENHFHSNDSFRLRNRMMNALSNQMVNEAEAIKVKDKLLIKLNKLRNLSMRPTTLSELHKSVTILSPEGY